HWLLTAAETERIAANPLVQRLLNGRPAPCRPLRLAVVGTAVTAEQAVAALAAGWDVRPEPLVRVLSARRPDWLAEFVQLWKHPSAKPVIELLQEAGLIQPGRAGRPNQPPV